MCKITRNNDENTMSIGVLTISYNYEYKKPIASS